MAVSATDWLDLIHREYLSRFIPGGGAAIKFIMGENDIIARVHKRLEALARDRRLQFVVVDAAATRLHMVQDIFFAIAREIDWDCWLNVGSKLYSARTNMTGHSPATPSPSATSHSTTNWMKPC